MITNINNIPQELKELKQWCCFGIDKIPKNARTGANAQSNNKDTWSSFDEAVAGCEQFGFEGLGFFFENGYFGVDLDHVIDNSDFCDEFVETLQSYTEYSRSGNGIHIICKGELPQGRKRKGNVEMYQTGRFFCLTGNLYTDKYKEVADCTETIKVLHSKYLPSETPKIEAIRYEIVDLEDAEVIDLARNCKTGYLFNHLYNGEWEGIYPSQSEADISFCNQLAFWTQKNESQMDRIFRSSGLYRKKWDEKRGGQTYGQITIGRACATCSEVYEPKKHDTGNSLAFHCFGDNKEVAVQTTCKEYDMSDTGNAHRLADRFGSIIRYSYNRKKWFYYDGKCWNIDEIGAIKKLVDIVIEDMKKEAFTLDDEEAQEQLLKWVSRSSSSKNKEAMIKECQHLDGIPVGVDEFDAFGEYINTQNGLVNLRNGELTPHEALHMASKITACEYDTEHKEPTKWLSFLHDVTGGNEELIDYMQRCIGYSMTGSTKEQCAFFLYGMGSNGKSTFLDTLSDLFGSYSSNVQPETLMMKKLGSDGANSDIARLKSTRFAKSEETTEGCRLNEGLLKQLTGGSRMTCRFLYGEEFEYTPEFKIWVATNHKPVIRGTDFGIWRRIKLIPFEVTIGKDKVDKDLRYKLRAEFPQILAWCVEGAIKYAQDGLHEPKCVTDGTKEYRQEMDVLAGFFEQCLEIDYNSSEKVYASNLFNLYMKWAKANNEWEMSSKKFNTEISSKIPTKSRDSKGVYYSNISFTEYSQELQGNQFHIAQFH